MIKVHSSSLRNKSILETKKRQELSLLLNTPKIRRKTIGNNYPEEIRELIMEKRRTRKKWRFIRSTEDKDGFKPGTTVKKRNTKNKKRNY